MGRWITLRLRWEAEPPMTVDHGRGGRLLHDGERRARHDMARLDPVDVGRNGDDAMGVVADQIGLDAPARAPPPPRGRGARRAQERDADFLEAVGLNRRHLFSSRY